MDVLSSFGNIVWNTMEYTVGITIGILLAVLTMVVLAKIYLWVYNIVIEKKEKASNEE